MMRACFAAAVASAAAALSANWTKPPRGWNSWFTYDVHINETVIRTNADGLVSTGLSELGYTFVNLDGGWQGGRWPNGSVYENFTAFPSGMGNLVDYVHARGLGFGFYTDRGKSTCDSHVGSAGFEAADALRYAEWGGDYIKEDSCDATMSHEGALAQFQLMQEGIAASGRAQYFSLCGWLKWYAGSASAAGIGQSWRIGPDALSWDNVRMNMDAAADAAPFVGPGKFADVDEIMGPSRGRPINQAQTLTQFSFIALVGSPLLLSFDLTNKTAADPDVAPFLNTEVLDVHWDDSMVYKRLSGGPISVDRITPLTNLACNASDPRQQWSFLPTSNTSVTPVTGYLQSTGAPGWCLMAGAAWTAECNNAQQIWLGPCGTGCCGAECQNMQFAFSNGVTGNPGTLQTLDMINSNAAGPYVTLDAPTPNSVFLEEFLNATGAGGQSGSQLWSFNTKTGLLQNTGSSTCVGASPQDTKNVWGRQLADGSLALLLVNFDAAPQTVTCDAACFAEAGVGAGTTLSVRDMWAHTDNDTVVAGAGYAVPLAANGASVFVRLTPAAA